MLWTCIVDFVTIPKKLSASKSSGAETYLSLFDLKGVNPANDAMILHSNHWNGKCRIINHPAQKVSAQIQIINIS